MFKKILLCGCMAVLAYGADKAWDKLKDLKTGTELRIYKAGAKQPILASMDEATDDRLVIVIKGKEQTSIEKDQIDRIDYRPPKSGSRVTTESRTTVEPPGQTAGPAPRGSSGGGGPATSSSSSLNIGKPDFETIYRKAR